ncbi:hypothetical protein ACFW61_36175 [Streptomyces microflavus]|uniref:hypothetical protein n=1 Tax=Streptomyces microflavus TaxID=1919 RepID=UPI0036B654C2
MTAVTGTAIPGVTRSGPKVLSPGGCAALVIYIVVLEAWREGLPRQGDVRRHARLSAGFSGVAAAAVVSVFNSLGDKVGGHVMRALFDRLYRGSTAVGWGTARGTVAWFKEGSGSVDFLIRLVFLLGGLTLVWGLVQSAPVLMSGLTIWWAVAAYRKGKPEEKAAEKAAPGIPGAGPAEGRLPRGPRDAPEGRRTPCPPLRRGPGVGNGHR